MVSLRGNTDLFRFLDLNDFGVLDYDLNHAEAKAIEQFANDFEPALFFFMLHTSIHDIGRIERNITMSTNLIEIYSAF